MRQAIVYSIGNEIRAIIQTRWLKRWKLYKGARSIKKIKHTPGIKVTFKL